MYMILHETGEYSDHGVSMLGYVESEEKAKEIVTRKNEELAKLFALQEKFYEFKVQYDETHQFKWNDYTSLDHDEEEMKAYETWNLERERDYNNWFEEQGVSKETQKKMQYLYNDSYLYRKIEEYKE